MTWKKIQILTSLRIIDVDVEELNDVLSSSGHIQVNEYDSNEINIENYNGDEDESTEKKKVFLINLHNTNL